MFCCFPSLFVSADTFPVLFSLQPRPPPFRRPTSPIYTGRRPSSFRSRHPHLVRMFPPIILAFRLLSIAPASLGCVFHIWDIVDPSRHLPHNTRLDYFVALLWVRLQHLLSRSTELMRLHMLWCLGYADSSPVSGFHKRTFPPLEGVLPACPDSYPSSRFAGYMLACHPLHLGSL